MAITLFSKAGFLAATAKPAPAPAPAPVAIRPLSGYMLGAGSSTPVDQATQMTATAKTPGAITPTPALASQPTVSTASAPATSSGLANNTVKGMLAFAGLATATNAGSKPAPTSTGLSDTTAKRAATADAIYKYAGSTFGVGPYSDAYSAAVKAGEQQAATAARQQGAAAGNADVQAAAAAAGLQLDHPLGSNDPLSPTASYSLSPVGDTAMPVATDASGSTGGIDNKLLLAGAAALVLLLVMHGGKK
jgi:hypothetical protein